MMTLEDWLDDLCVRFFLNIPAEELRSLERICFQIEEAQWFYEDFIRPLDPSLPSLSLKPFFQRITPRCPILLDLPQQEMDTAYERFLQYKQRVPVRGVILLNDAMDEVLLVKGWKKSGTWSFPRGKINKDEDDLDCAIREAWEETGFDLRAAGLVKDPRKIKHIEKTMRAQNMKLFVFRGVPQDANFVPQTRKEISKIEWFRLAELPTEKRKAPQEGTGQHLMLNANKFYVVAPFVNDLKKIINAERRKDHRQASRAAPAVTALPTPESHIPILPMSPAIPSSLPEVAMAHPSAVPAVESHSDTMSKSNALLALLRNGPPQEHIQPLNTPQSPEQYARPHPNMNVQSPPAISDLHQQVHPSAPPSSAVPQLSQHTRTLLDAFKQPVAQSPPPRNIPLAKQSLLAAFGATPAAISPQPPPATLDQGSNLLRLLQRTPDVAQATIQPSAQTNTILNDKSPAQEQPFVNPLLNLLKTQEPAEQAQLAAPAPAPAPTPAQPQPVELSAAPAQFQKTQPSPNPKDALLSLLGATPKAAIPRTPQTKSKSGTTSATLDQPIDQPQFDAISKAPTIKDDVMRPVNNEKKLFDHKTGSIRSVPPKPIVVGPPKLEDRPKAQKSPRNVRQKQVNSPGRRPLTPKEPAKPFQPQILKRSQVSEGEDLSSILPLRQKEEPIQEATAPASVSATAAAAAATTVPAFSLPLMMDSVPLSPSLHAPQPVLSEVDPIFRPDLFTPQRPATQVASPVPDPQREALLALLKTPVKSPSPVSALPDNDMTPKAPVAMMQPQVSIDEAINAQPASQIISPIQDPEPIGNLSRSRVSSLASTGNGAIGNKPVLEKRQTAANEKAFLMQYLKGLTSQETAN